MARPCMCRRVSGLPENTRFSPCPVPCECEPQCGASWRGENILGLDCVEALRLADYECLGMDEAATRMGISRHTFGRLLRKARFCVAQALCEGRRIVMEGGACVFPPDNEGESGMSEAILVAIPSDAPGGLEAAPSAHFGHCAAYTIAKVENGTIGDVKVLENRGHEHGGCVQPVQELARSGVTALLAGGMGMRPLMAMRDAGITAYYSTGYAKVKDALEAFAAGKLPAFGTDQLCKGNCGHHH